MQPGIDMLPRESELPDEAVVRRVLAGERPMFAVLMRRYNRRAFRIARGILGSDAEAEDAAQDAFIAAYEKLAQLTEPARFGPWVSRITANRALHRIRRRRKLAELIERGDVVPMPDQTSIPSPESVAADHELRVVLEDAIDRLPDIYRAVMVMRDVELMSSEETAEVLAIDVGTVRVRLHRARKMVRRDLSSRFDAQNVDAFAFDGARCDRLVAAVFRRLGW